LGWDAEDKCGGVVGLPPIRRGERICQR
jgi:hypothetical protein